MAKQNIGVLQAENKTLKEAIKELTFSLAEVNQEKQSLQAYNGKLVEALAELLDYNLGDDWPQYGGGILRSKDLSQSIKKAKSALSSFTDKEIKP